MTPEHPTFDRLCELCPELGALYDLAEAVRDDGSWHVFCANYLWYENVKPRLIRLVGSEARWIPDDDPGRMVIVTGEELLERAEKKWEVHARRALPEHAALLRSSAAYDVAYQTIYHALPDCRHDGLCWGSWSRSRPTWNWKSRRNEATAVEEGLS